MTMAAAIEDRTAEANVWSKASRIAGIDIVHDLAAAEGIWRSLEGPQTLFTPYQRFDFLSPWEGAKHVLPGDEKATTEKPKS